MSYEHIAMIPFLIDASHLTPEEVAERDANPVLWAARRYGQPEHIFRAAAERHESESSKSERPMCLGNYGYTSAAPFCPDTLRLVPKTNVPAILDEGQGLRGQQPASARSVQSPPMPICSSTHSPASPIASSPSGSYFSTVLSPSASLDETGIDPPPVMQRSRQDGQERSNGQVQTAHNGSVSNKKGKLRA